MGAVSRAPFAFRMWIFTKQNIARLVYNIVLRRFPQSGRGHHQNFDNRYNIHKEGVTT